MLLNLYGDKGLVFNILATGFKEAHLQDKLKFDVVEAEKVGAKFKEAVKKAYNAKFLDDADMVIRFAEPNQAPVSDDSSQDNAGSEETQDTGAEENTQDTGDTENAGGSEEKKEVSEAETNATGADLKKKIIDTVARCLYQEDKNKVELSDLEGLIEGYNVSFIKVSLKEKETDVTSEA